jgi:hypothetical protein
MTSASFSVSSVHGREHVYLHDRSGSHDRLRHGTYVKATNLVTISYSDGSVETDPTVSAVTP